MPALRWENAGLIYSMETSEHTFPLPELEVHKLEEAQHQLEESVSGGSPALDFFAANKWPLIIFGALGAAIGFALRSRR